MEEFKSEKEKMIAGALYFASDPELVADRKKAREQMALINQQPDTYIRRQLIEETFGKVGVGTYIEPMIQFDYGYNISVGKNFYANFNNVFLDVCPIEIGDNCMFGPNVQLYTAEHPLQAAKRNSGMESGKRIIIGNNVWIGGGAIVLPGVTLGDNVVVAAGAVVTKSFPENCVIAGNPARIIKELTEDDAPTTSLEQQRAKINQIDKELVRLLEQRMDVVAEIAAVKKKAGHAVFDSEREQQLLETILNHVENAEYEETLSETFQGIMDASKRFQEKHLGE